MIHLIPGFVSSVSFSGIWGEMQSHNMIVSDKIAKVATYTYTLDAIYLMLVHYYFTSDNLITLYGAYRTEFLQMIRSSPMSDVTITYVFFGKSIIGRCLPKTSHM